MSTYYNALIAAWNGATQPPTGVTGTGLNGSMTTAQKIAAVQAWTVVGLAPTAFQISGAQIASCINYAEFKALTAQQQANVLGLCQISGTLTGGSAETAMIVDGMFIDYFGPGSQTIATLTALAQAVVQPFWETVGLSGPITQADLTASGLS